MIAERTRPPEGKRHRTSPATPTSPRGHQTASARQSPAVSGAPAPEPSSTRHHRPKAGQRIATELPDAVYPQDYRNPAARGELVDALARDARALLAALDGPTAGPQARHGRRTRHRGFDGYQGHIAIDLDARTVTCPAGVTMRIRAGGVTVTLARPGSGSSAPRARWLTGAPPLGRAAPLPSARTRPGWPPPARPRPAQPGRLATKQPAQGGAQDRPPHAPARRRAHRHRPPGQILSRAARSHVPSNTCAPARTPRRCWGVLRQGPAPEPSLHVV